MTQSKKHLENKTPPLVWKILRCLARALVGLLLITLVVFQAPWKIITLLTVVFLACTVLPRQLRKWFWLAAAAVLIAVTVWVLLPEDNYNWRPFMFDEQIALHEEKYAIPYEQNAAVIYNKLLHRFDPYAMELKFLPPGVRKVVLSQPWKSGDHPELVRWLQRRQPSRRGRPAKLHPRTRQLSGRHRNLAVIEPTNRDPR